MKRFLPLLLLVLFTAHDAFADGMVARKRIATAYVDEVNIPDQRALIHFTNGVERLVIETRFTGQGSNFCWVVPLPSQPVVEESTTGLFPTLEFLLEPQVIHSPMGIFSIGILCVIILYVFLLTDAKEPRPEALILPLIVAVLIGIHSIPVGILGAVVCWWGWRRMRGGGTSVVGILGSLLVFLLLGTMMLPTLGKSRALPTPPGDITELEHKQVGIFDVATVTSTNSTALVDWLIDNGFEAPLGTREVVQDYVKEGWVFSVAKINRTESDSQTNAIHPLAFTFKTSKAVYPMRLTALTSKKLRVELYVAGEGRAFAEGFNVQRCVRVVDASKASSRKDQLAPAHPEIRKQIERSSAITKLTGTLGVSDMKRDVLIDYKPFAEYAPTLYSRKGALITAANWASWLGLVVWIGACFVSVFRAKPLELSRMMLITVGVGSVILLLVYLSLPTTPIRLSKTPRYYAVQQVRLVGVQTIMGWQDSPPKTLEDARKVATAVATKPNYILGGKIHEEDSPGNYMIRQSTNGFEFVWFAADGSEQSFDR